VVRESFPEETVATHAKVRVALIGAGGWGREHARIFSARPDVDFVAICGRSAEKTAARAAAHGVRAYTDIGHMLDAEKPDLVSICLGNQDHFVPTLEVIRAGYPLFVEKPFVFDLREADTLVAEAEQRKLFFAINFNHHYAQPVARGHRDIAAGRLGEIMFASWRFGGHGGLSHPFNNLIETQCHGFDMLEYLCGPIDAVAAQMTDKTAGGFFRTLAVALHFRNGAVGTLLGSYDTSYAYPQTHAVEVSGTKGRLLIEDTVRRYSFSPHDSETAEVWQAGYFNDVDRSFYLTFDKHVDALLANFKAGKGPPVHARAGRRALQLALACIESFEGGRRVEVETTSFQAADPAPVTAPPPSP
jgi:myo-inositol 2-dehydrogenase/D-chiro-inositol 1-dehydrogenase